MGNEQEARFIAIIGVTGCGKSTELKRRLRQKKRHRTLIWSPKEAVDNYAGLYAGSVVVRSCGEVLEILKKAGAAGKFHIVFEPTLNQKRDTELFSVVCKMLLLAKNLTLIAEELHSVTTASHAPDGWRKICFMGRAYGVEVFGLSQRPASVDKAFMGSVSEVYCGRLPHAPDQKTMAEILGVNRQEVAALVGYQSITRDMNSGKITRKN